MDSLSCGAFFTNIFIVIHGCWGECLVEPPAAFRSGLDKIGQQPHSPKLAQMLQ